MGKDLFRRILPHLAATGVFLIVALLFCKPALEGKVLKQGDIISWRAMAQGSFEYKEKHGHFPVWTTNMFSGMPGYQIAGEGPTVITGFLHKVFSLGLPRPFNFFFLACICFYFLCVCLRVHTALGILGSLAFAYASYSAIIVGAGHETKMLAMAYVPALLGAVTLLFQKKYVWGFVLTALFTFLQLAMNHQQISYYAFLIIAAMSISHIVYSIKDKAAATGLKSTGLAAAAGLLGVLGVFYSILPNYEYAKESKRGGYLVIDTTKKSAEKTKGMSQEYAFQWSLGKVETGTLLIPGIVGYGAKGYEPNPAKSAIGNFISRTETPQAVNQNDAANNAYNHVYWGGQPFTDGPFYIGAITCFLAILGFIVLPGRQKWWVLGISIFGVLLAWGKYLPGFNTFMFNHLPLYNKFRVPTVTLVVVQMVFPILAVLVLQQLLFGPHSAEHRKALFKKTLFAGAGVVVLMLALLFGASLSDENTTRTRLFNQALAENNPAARDTLIQQLRETVPGADNQIRESILQRTGPDGSSYAAGLVKAVKKERKAILGKSMVRSLVFVLLAMGILLAFLRFGFNPLIAGVLMVAIVAADQLSFASKYLNKENYGTREELNRLLNPATMDDLADYQRNMYESTLEQLQQQYPDANYQQLDQYAKSMAAGQAKYYETLIRVKQQYKDNNFRVHNLLDDPWNRSTGAYYVPIIGGYHPAKIGRYDDLITYQLGNGNPAVLDMLNTKFILDRDSNNVPAIIDRRTNLGNCWFVREFKSVKSDTEEMLALNNFNPAQTAVVNDDFKDVYSKQPLQYDSAASIKQTVFDNDHITYESNAAGAQFAVFSEVYYSKGWKAYIDGNEVPYCRVNYVLRGLPVPAGKHKIEFIFKPASIKTSFMISTIFGNLILLLLVAAGWWQYRKIKPGEVTKK